jgi:hypothetical protein
MALQASTSVYRSLRANALQVTRSPHLADPSQEKNFGLFFGIRKAIATHEETIRRLLILVALYAIPAVMVMRPVLDPDIWWHLRTGQWIIEHGAVPHTDTFSIYGMGKPWIAYSWLVEVLVYGLYSWFGLIGILLYAVIMSLAVVLAIHHLIAKREPRFVVASSLVGLVTIAILPVLSERPWLFTILFFTLTLDAVLSLREGTSTKAVWLLPLMYAFWANMHIQFVYGLSLLALACAAPIGDHLLSRGESGDHAGTAGSQGWKQLVALTGACFAATLLTPYHVRLYGVVIELATQNGVYGFVQELMALDFREWPHWVVLAMTGAAAFAIGRRLKPSVFEVLLLVISAYCSFRAGRDCWFVAIASAAIIATCRSTAVAGDDFALTKLRALFVTVAIIAVLVVVGRIRNISDDSMESVLAERYPVAAAAVVEEREYPGPLYNHFNWGGYLIWRLPRIPVGMDGRGNVHGDKRIKRSLETWAGLNGWASDPDLTAARLVIAEVNCPLASLLRFDARFELVYEDKVSALFVARRHPEVSERFSSIE